jgi:tight adherence protein B
MMESIGGNFSLIVVVLVFVSVVLLLEGLYMMWQTYKGPEARKIEKRLRALSAAVDNTRQAQLLKQRMLSAVPAFERLLLSFPRIRGLERWILQAGLDWTVSRLLLSCALFAVSGCMAMTLFAHQSVLIGLVVGAISACAPALYVQYKRNRRLSRIEQQLPEALDLLSRALRSGHAFPSGLRMIGDEMPEPIANEFRIVHDEINFGVSLQQALTNLTVRVPGTDLRYFVVAVLVQRESGGNLTEILGNLSRLIRNRFTLLAKIKVLSSEGRLSAWILTIMPFALAGLMNAMNPKFMAPLWTDPIGLAILKYTLILMTFGIVILRKIVNIRV